MLQCFCGPTLVNEAICFNLREKHNHHHRLDYTSIENIVVQASGTGPCSFERNNMKVKHIIKRKIHKETN